MSKTEREIFQEVEDKYQASKVELDKRFEDFNEFEDLYWGYIDKSKNAWKSSIFDPEAFEKVERPVAHLFSTVPRGRVMPRDNMDDLVKAPIHEELMKYQWARPGQNMQSKLQRVGRNTYIFGTGFSILEWRFEQEIKEIDGVPQVITTWDDPFFKDLFIYDCFPDPSATDPEDMQYFIVNEYVTLAQLKAGNDMGKRYKNLKALDEQIKEAKKKDASTDSFRNRADKIQGLTTDNVKDRILIRRMFTKDRWVTVTPDYKLVIEDRPNPYTHGELPIHVLVDYEYPNQLYGRGEIEIIRKLQKGLNNVLNQRLDNVRLLLNPVIKTSADSRYAHTWKFKPGQKWVLDRNDQIDQFQLTDVTGNTFQQTVNYFKDSMAGALGNHDVMTRDQRKDQNVTATRDKLAAGEQNARMKMKEANIDGFITRLANQWIQLNQQFIKDARVLRIMGKDVLQKLQTAQVQDDGTGKMVPSTAFMNGLEVPKLSVAQDGNAGSLVVSPDDLVGSFDFIVETGSTIAADPTDDFQNLMTAINVLKGAEQEMIAQGTMINYQPILEKALMKLGVKDIDNIFQKAPPPMPPMGQPGMPGQGGPEMGGAPPMAPAPEMPMQM